LQRRAFESLYSWLADPIRTFTRGPEYSWRRLKYQVRKDILESRGMEIGWIMYDVEDEKDLRRRQSVVVGRTRQGNGPKSNGLDNREYHILLVRQRGENEYERVGIGMVQQGYLLRQQLEVRIL
jgi:hypothetical protein